MENERDGFAINVAVVDDAIIVTMPGTRYSITYRKGPDPWLLASTPETSEEAAIRKREKNAVTAVRLRWTKQQGSRPAHDLARRCNPKPRYAKL